MRGIARRRSALIMLRAIPLTNGFCWNPGRTVAGSEWKPVCDGRYARRALTRSGRSNRGFRWGQCQEILGWNILVRIVIGIAVKTKNAECRGGAPIHRMPFTLSLKWKASMPKKIRRDLLGLAKADRVSTELTKNCIQTLLLPGLDRLCACQERDERLYLVEAWCVPLRGTSTIGPVPMSAVSHVMSCKGEKRPAQEMPPELSEQTHDAEKR